MDTLIFHSRKEKEIFMREVIQKLHISIPEKEIFAICIEILEDKDFELFFIKIFEQFKWLWENIGEQKVFNLIAQ